MDAYEIAKKLFFRGMESHKNGNFQAAEEFFLKALALVPERVSVLTNLSATQIEMEKYCEAEQHTRTALLKDNTSVFAWVNLGIALYCLDRKEEALAAYEQAIECDDQCHAAWTNKAALLSNLGRYQEAVVACDHVLDKDPHELKTLYAKSVALSGLGEILKSRLIYTQAITIDRRLTPVVSAERRSSQKYIALIVSPNIELEDVSKSLDVHHRFGNYPSQLTKLFLDKIHFSFVLTQDFCSAEVRRQLPHVHIVINNNANAEILRADEELPKFLDACDDFGVPVLNHPRKALYTTRTANAEVLAGLSGVVVPRTVRFDFRQGGLEHLVDQIEGLFDYPFITRTLSNQEGKGMSLVRTREELAPILTSQFSGREFLITEFIDSRGDRKFFRKMRTAFVGDSMILTRVDYDVHWNINGRKTDERVAFYLENKGLMDEGEEICSDPEGVLGNRATQALREIRKRIPLEVGGIDFDVDSEGSVVFYESNATMNLFSTAKPEVDYPREPEEQLKMAFDKYFELLVSV